MVVIANVEKNSIAEHHKIAPGDVLLSINGNEINDVLDYRFYLTDAHIRLSLMRDIKPYAVEILKPEYKDIGLAFETPLMDHKKTCRNKCIFCFIDQMPKGMRETLYFKDDDERLSFLHGNYVTLTNLSEHDIDRIIKMHLSPVNVSVHTTDPALRVQMMKNKRAGEVLAYLPRLAASGIDLNIQIVLCRGINDGKALDRTLRELAEIRPRIASCSVVPAGLTDHREGLYPLTPFTPQECAAIIDQIDGFGEKMKEEYDERVFYPSDEFFLTAGRPFPPEAYYDGYPQLENGVGMSTMFLSDADYAISRLSDRELSLVPRRTVSVATGKAAYPLIRHAGDLLMSRCPQLCVKVYPIENRTFGKNITVSGLLTGRDIAFALKGEKLGELLLFPKSALRAVEQDFLCGMTPDELSVELGIPVKASGGAEELIDDLIGKEKHDS